MTQIQAPRDATKAASGTYSVGVSQLAQTAKLSSASIAPGTTSTTACWPSRPAPVRRPSSSPRPTPWPACATPSTASDAGVNATIVSDGTNDHLVTAKDSGAANTIKRSPAPATFGVQLRPQRHRHSPNVTTGQTYTSGTLSLKVGDTTFAINPTANGSGNIDLNQVMSAINGASAGVTASISNDGSKDHLVLTPTGSATAPCR
jgi:flagellar hook-associated protein 2